MSNVKLTYVEAFNLSTVMESVMEQKMPGSVAAKFVRLIKPFENLQKDYNTCIEKLSSRSEEEIAELNNSIFSEFETLTEKEIEGLTLSPLDILRLKPILVSS